MQIIHLSIFLAFESENRRLAQLRERRKPKLPKSMGSYFYFWHLEKLKRPPILEILI
jgi:hypothetical protein